MPYALNKNVRLYWEEHGSGPPVLLIMGLSFTHEMWFRLLPALSARYRAISFDNRGMGRSDCPSGPYSIRRMAQDAATVMDAAGASSAHVVGASMGGMIAQELALRSPKRVRSLLLACTSHSGLFGAWPHFRYAPHIQRVRRATRAEREHALRRFLYATSTPPERIDEDVRVRCQCAWNHRGFWSQLAGILAWSAYGRLPRIKVPTVVIHGAEDHLVPPENGRVVASRIPSARFHLMPDAGHLLMTDQPELCTEMLLDFLDEQTREQTASEAGRAIS